MSSFFGVTFADVDELCSPEMETLVYHCTYSRLTVKNVASQFRAFDFLSFQYHNQDKAILFSVSFLSSRML